MGKKYQNVSLALIKYWMFAESINKWVNKWMAEWMNDVYVKGQQTFL